MSKTTTPTHKRKFDSCSSSDPFKDTPEVATQRDEFMEMFEEESEEDRNDQFEYESEEDDEEDEEEREHLLEKRQTTTRKKIIALDNADEEETNKRTLNEPSKVKEKDGKVRIGLKRVPARKSTITEIDLSTSASSEEDEEEEEDDEDLQFALEKDQSTRKLETKKGKRIQKDSGAYIFQDETFNNIPSAEKGGFMNDLTYMYEDFIKKRKRSKTREVKEHPLIFNLETIVFMLAYERMYTEDNQLYAKEQAQIIQSNIDLIMETLQENVQWRKDLFIHFHENKNKNPNDESAVFLWPPEFVAHMEALKGAVSKKGSKKNNEKVSLGKKSTPEKRISVKEENEALEAKGKNILEKIRVIKTEIRNFANAAFPDEPSSGDNPNTLLFKTRGKLYVTNRQRQLRTNFQKKNSDRKKKKESMWTADQVNKYAEEEWNTEWEAAKHSFPEEWFPRYWLYFILCGKPAPAEKKNISALTYAEEMQNTEHQGRAVRRKAKELLHAKIKNQSSEVLADDIGDEDFRLEKPSPRNGNNSRRNSSTSESTNFSNTNQMVRSLDINLRRPDKEVDYEEKREMEKKKDLEHQKDRNIQSLKEMIQIQKDFIQSWKEDMQELMSEKSPNESELNVLKEKINNAKQEIEQLKHRLLAAHAQIVTGV